jgi:hypothetical protein
VADRQNDTTAAAHSKIEITNAIPATKSMVGSIQGRSEELKTAW